MEKKNCKFASEDVIAIEELAEQLADELDINEDVEQAPAAEDTVPIVEGEDDGNIDDLIAEAESMIAEAELPDEKDVVSEEDEADQILAEAEELEQQLDAVEAPAPAPELDEAQQIAAEADELEKQLDACEAGEDCPECGNKPCTCEATVASEKKASEVKPGIEDKIGDEAHGGDPSVSDLPDTKIDCDTDKEVFGQNTDSEYVAKITARLDRVANALEKRGMKRMAFRIDQLSDRIEASIKANNDK